MPLPTYDKSKRRTAVQQLPKGAYVIKILNAKEVETKWGDRQLEMAFDIAEGEYKDIYMSQYQRNSNEDKKWPFDAIFQLTIPADGCQEYVWTNWNSFFADLEDSNNGFVFAGDVSSLKGKLIGGKFRIEQTEYHGNIYDHTRMHWSCVADDVRNGKAGRMPNDKLINKSRTAQTAASADPDGFVPVPDGTPEEIPW